MKPKPKKVYLVRGTAWVFFPWELFDAQRRYWEVTPRKVKTQANVPTPSFREYKA